MPNGLRPYEDTHLVQQVRKDLRRDKVPLPRVANDSTLTKGEG